MSLSLAAAAEPLRSLLGGAPWRQAQLTRSLSLAAQTLGTAACPPYHLAVVIGGLSAEQTLKTVKLASTKYLDNLHTR
jgi:fumarate hydratase class I